MNTLPENHKSGFVTILGKPNAGKSTLLNAFLERKLVITTAKAQTTRHRILGILNGDDYQIVFSDTPGVITPKYKLHNKMMKSVSMALEDAEMVILLIDVKEKFSEDDLIELAKNVTCPVILAINKTDLSKEKEINIRSHAIAEQINPAAIVHISALYRANVDELIEKVVEHLPQGPPYYDKRHDFRSPRTLFCF